VHSSPFFTQHFITISPLVPPLFVDCCFKRRTKPLLPTMVSSLSSRPSALVGCFRCPPPPTLAASHGSRHQQSIALIASTLTLPSPCPPLVVATPLCGVFLTLAARLAARTYDAAPWGAREASPIPSCEGGAGGAPWGARKASPIPSCEEGASGIIFLLIS